VAPGDREGILKLYHFPSSPHSLKVRAVAYELGVPLDLTPVNILRHEADAPFFRTLNPNGLVPVLVDGDFVLWESNAIVTYLATTHPTPSLLPTDARERADVDRWLHWQSAHLGPAISRIAFERFVKPMTRQGASDEVVVTSARHDFTRHCAALEASLVDAEYIAGRLTVADFALACVLNTAAMVGLDLQAFRRTSAWLQRMLARDSLKRALADAHESLKGMYGSPVSGEDGRKQ
jgi:glutathione S-transferase